MHVFYPNYYNNLPKKFVVTFHFFTFYYLTLGPSKAAWVVEAHAICLAFEALKQYFLENKNYTYMDGWSSSLNFFRLTID
jgi:hypothetical protein